MLLFHSLYLVCASLSVFVLDLCSFFILWFCFMPFRFILCIWFMLHFHSLVLLHAFPFHSLYLVYASFSIIGLGLCFPFHSLYLIYAPFSFFCFALCFPFYLLILIHATISFLLVWVFLQNFFIHLIISPFHSLSEVLCFPGIFQVIFSVFYLSFIQVFCWAKLLKKNVKHIYPCLHISKSAGTKLI